MHAGLAAVRSGGNAVDAAIAAMVAAMSTEPGIVSALGGAYVTIWPAGGDPEVIDGNVEMPGRGLPPERFGAGLREFDVDYGGGITLYAGHGSVATPGAFAALGTAHERHGAAPWRDVLAPAADAVRAGFHIGAAAASYLAITADSIFGWDENTRPLVARPTAPRCTPATSSARPTSRRRSTSSASRATAASTRASWLGGSRLTPPRGAGWSRRRTSRHTRPWSAPR